ncbi:MAG: OsmC family protein [Thermoplasmatota archaeon]
MDNNIIKVEMENLEGYKFKVKFDKESMGEIITDETKEVGGEGEGPNPSRLLAASTLNCLMASLIFCLKKKKVELSSLEGEVTGKIERVDKRLRVTEFDVKIDPGIDEEDKEKLKKCIDIFENYCVVTQSIKNGIDVNVDVEV